ncbi:hypothetical protein DRB07_15360 [Actinomyces sp. Z3]|nr:hypothetical protein DRB07_15360 [Actinomyces sp. Z3]
MKFTQFFVFVGVVVRARGLLWGGRVRVWEVVFGLTRTFSPDTGRPRADEDVLAAQRSFSGV